MAEVAQAPLEDVVGDVDRGVTEMGGVVGRDAAGVHRHDRSRFERDDPCLPAVS